MKRICCFVFISLVLACSFGRSPKTQNKCICVLFDLSLSTQKEVVRDSYMLDLNKIFASIQPGDVLVATLITGHSISELEFCVQHVFESFDPGTDNELKKKALWAQFQKIQAACKDSLVSVIDSTLHQKSNIIKTEIMGALDVAARTFRNYKMPKNVLVVFSDMLEDSQFYRFDKENLTPQRIVAIIENEKSSERLPKFQGVKIYVTGAMSQDRKRFLAVRSFWLKYFAECGALLSEDHYGSILIRFDE